MRAFLLVAIVLLCSAWFFLWWLGGRGIMIAHAGGGLEGQTYTNSLTAMDHNYKAGFRLFEIDLALTSDGALVCAHDWRSVSGVRPTLAEWRGSEGALAGCEAETLAAWFQVHTDAFLITDVKDADQQPILPILLASGLPKNRTIVQIYSPEEHDVVRDMGFDLQILTLYRYQGGLDEIKALSESRRILALTMPDHMARSGFANKFPNTPTFTHTINNRLHAGRLRLMGIDGIYTDFIMPTEDQTNAFKKIVRPEDAQL